MRELEKQIASLQICCIILAIIIAITVVFVLTFAAKVNHNDPDIDADTVDAKIGTFEYGVTTDELCTAHIMLDGALSVGDEDALENEFGKWKWTDFVAKAWVDDSGLHLLTAGNKEILFSNKE